MANFRDHPDLRPFVLSNVRLTGIRIGAGAYGSVEEVAVLGTIRAAKRIHEVFLDRTKIPDDEIQKAATDFVEECQLMSTLRHPHIVQFLGVCFLQGSRLPALVMERLLTSLHDLLAPETQPPPGSPGPLSYFSMSLKCSVLHNVASGLAYLHERTPPVIHRDLSARNVLLNSGTVAKIADLGVARIVPRLRPATTMTKAPGASVYMPPEAVAPSASNREKSKYDASIDIFSFGVVTIFTIGEKFPCDPLAYNYIHEKRGLVARTELQRRGIYMANVNAQLRACGQLRGDHPLIRVIQQCLENIPAKRPGIREVLRLLEEARVGVRDEESERNKHELVRALHNLTTKRKQLTAKETIRSEQQQIQEMRHKETQKDELVQVKDRELARAQQQLRLKETEKDEFVQAKDRELVQAQQQLRQKETEKDELVQAKDKELARAQQQLRQKEAEKNELVQAKDRELAQVQQQLRQKETEKDELVQAKDRELALAQQQLKQKETEKDELVQAKDRELVWAQQQLKQKETEKDELVQAKDRELAQAQQQLRQKETEKDELVQAKDGELAQAQRQLRQKETEKVQAQDRKLALTPRQKEEQLRSSEALVADLRLQQTKTASYAAKPTNIVATNLAPCQLSLPGKTLPPALPLIISCQDNWNPESCKLEVASDTGGQHGVKLVADALELLRSIDKPLAVLSICGPYRSGKSYFMSRLLGKPGAFRIGHSMRACTHGIWMATTVLECDEFATIVLDTEGIDAVRVSETMAMSLLTLTTLLSSYLIYNSKKVPQKVDLDKMRCFSQLSTSLLAQRGESMTAGAMKKFFPQFLWLLRDVSLKITNKEGELISATEYLHTRLLASDSGQPTDLGRSLFNLFPSLECSTLPVASKKPNVIRNIVEQQDDLNPGFNTAVNALIQQILQQMAPKKAIDGINSVNGPKLAALACSYVEAINTPGALPDLEQGWQAVIRLELKEYSDKLVEEYEKNMMSYLEGSLPMSEENLLRIHEETMKWRKSCLHQEIRRINPLNTSDEDMEPYLSQLENDIVKWSEPDEKGERKVIGGVLYQFTTKNYTESKKQCEKLLAAILRKNQLEDFVNEVVQRSIAIDISKEIDELIEEYKREADGPAADDVLEKAKMEFAHYKDILKKIPGIPSNARVVGIGPNEIKIRWYPPKYNPDSVENYVVSKRIEGGEWEEVVTTKKTCTAALITGLKSHKKYDIKVLATNSLVIGLQNWGSCETRISNVASAAIGAGAGALFAPAYIGSYICERYNVDTPSKQAGVYFATVPLSFLIFPVTLTISAADFAKKYVEDRGDLTPVPETWMSHNT